MIGFTRAGCSDHGSAVRLTVTLSASFLCYTRGVETTAQFEKYFDRCPNCSGTGFAARELGQSTTLCSSCHGSAMALSLANDDVVISLPLFVDFTTHVKALIFKIIFVVLASIFLTGVPYVIYLYAVGFVRRLTNL